MVDGVGTMVDYCTDTYTHLRSDLLVCSNLEATCLSVRKPVDSKTVVIIGQDDEAIFKQFLFLTKMWVGPYSREPPRLPKDKGSAGGTIILAFICRVHSLS